MEQGTIAVLGWGSLIWRPDGLLTDGHWKPGPVLPIEFSRISENGRLTLVIDERDGVPIPTRYALSICQTVEAAIENLREREGSPTAKGIGYVDIRTQRSSESAVSRHPNAVEAIKQWALEQKHAAVIWTAIGPRYPKGTFSVDGAIDYLKSLEGDKREKAFEYIRNAPAEVLTPLRRKFIVDVDTTPR